nr:reverse transcriptase domain-containing protein [Tanacetum cinerariifolium]
MTNVGNQNTNDVGQNVKCNRCGMQHYGNCSIKCNKCGKIGHKARDCWSKSVAIGANAQPIVSCYGCGEKGHVKTNCPARNNPGRNEARGQIYALRDGDQNLGPNVVTGDGYHVVPPSYTGTFMLPKPDLVFHDAPNVNETTHTAFNVELSPTKLDKDFSHTHRPSAPIIEPNEQVKTPRPSVKTIETSTPTANHKTTIPKPKNNGNHRNRKACFV